MSRALLLSGLVAFTLGLVLSPPAHAKRHGVLDYLGKRGVPEDLVTRLEGNPQALKAVARAMKMNHPFRKLFDRLPTASQHRILKAATEQAPIAKSMLDNPRRALEMAHVRLPGEDEGEVADDEGEVADDEGEVADDEGEVADDEGEVADDEGEVADDEGEVADDEGEVAADESPSSPPPRKARRVSDAPTTRPGGPRLLPRQLSLRLRHSAITTTLRNRILNDPAAVDLIGGELRKGSPFDTRFTRASVRERNEMLETLLEGLGTETDGSDEGLDAQGDDEADGRTDGADEGDVEADGEDEDDLATDE